MNTKTKQAMQAECDEFVTSNVRAFDAGTLEAWKVAHLDAVMPEWNSLASRLDLGLEVTDRAYAGELGRLIAEFDSGLMASSTESRLDRNLGIGWHDDETREIVRKFTSDALTLGEILDAILAGEAEDAGVDIASLSPDYVAYLADRVEILAGFGLAEIEDFREALNQLRFVDMFLQLADHVVRVPNMFGGPRDS